MSITGPTVEQNAAQASASAHHAFAQLQFPQPHVSLPLAKSRVERAMTTFAADFNQPLILVNIETGESLGVAQGGLTCDLYDRLGLLASVAQRGKAEIIEDESPLAMLAIPLSGLSSGPAHVAVGLFVTEQVDSVDSIAAASHVFGIDAERAFNAAKQMEVWSPRVLLHLASASLLGLQRARLISQLQQERDEAVAHTADTYVELDLLHRLTRQLHLSESESSLWQNALEWLNQAVPAQCLAVVARRSTDEQRYELQLDSPTGVLTYGDCPLEKSELSEFVHRIQQQASRRTLVFSRAETSLPTWTYPTVRELICVPLRDSDRQQGWLLALNHRGRDDGQLGEFGSVASQLVGSIGTILSVHCSNRSRYREQADLFSNAVRALTTAIDAKDRYTSGHSDRVARVSVCLGEHLGLDAAELEQLYLGGLLHDIGKIGVDDHVLNKTGSLTYEEFEQIKEHPQLGYDILCGVREMDEILPIVLHHHESWDGTGYPHQLAQQDIPRLARIVAVADAFDAMGSDRSYRKGMPDEKVDSILRSGAGQQWDAEVVKAFFSVREEIREIANSEANGVVGSLDGSRWVD